MLQLLGGGWVQHIPNLVTESHHGQIKKKTRSDTPMYERSQNANIRPRCDPLNIFVFAASHKIHTIPF
jgi:hypothetical protein